MTLPAFLRKKLNCKELANYVASHPDAASLLIIASLDLQWSRGAQKAVEWSTLLATLQRLGSITPPENVHPPTHKEKVATLNRTRTSRRRGALQSSPDNGGSEHEVDDRGSAGASESDAGGS